MGTLNAVCRRGIAFVTTILLALGVPAAARAQAGVPANGDSMLNERIVTLRDGSIFRGVIVELIPGDYLILRTAGGEQRKILLSDIQSQAIVSPAQPPAASLPPPVPPPSLMPAPTPIWPPVPVASLPSLHRMRVHIDSPKPDTRLYRQIASAMVSGWAIGGGMAVGRVETWQLACVAPCDALIEPAERFQIRGPGMTSSGLFDLPLGASEISLTVRPGNRGLRAGGLALTVTGGLLLLAGVVTAPAGLVYDALYPRPSASPAGASNAAYLQELNRYNESQARARGFYIVGGSIIGAGAALLIPGIALLIVSRTKIEATSNQQALGVRLSGERGPILTAHGLLF